MSRPIIAVDVDDVLSLSAKGFSEYSNKRWGGSTRPEDYTEEWAVFWKLPLNEAIIRAEEFSGSDAVYFYEHFEESLPVLEASRRSYDLVIVTSRRSELKGHTDRWLEERFPGIFTAVHYAGIWDTDEHVSNKLKQTKTEVCRQLGASYLIDDQTKHCIAAQGAGLQALLFGDYAWNQSEAVSPDIVRVSGWQEVKEYFDAKG